MEDDFSSRPTTLQRLSKPTTALALTIVAGMALVVPMRNLRQRSLDRALFEVSGDDVGRVAELLQQGANINAVRYSPALHPSWIDSVKRRFGFGTSYCLFGEHEIDGGTLLHYAIRGKDQLTITYLIEHGADVTRTSTGGTTPLMLAAMHGNEDLCRALIEHGADINSQTLGGTTALRYAVLSQNKDIRKLLISYRARE